MTLRRPTAIRKLNGRPTSCDTVIDAVHARLHRQFQLTRLSQRLADPNHSCRCARPMSLAAAHQHHPTDELGQKARLGRHQILAHSRDRNIALMMTRGRTRSAEHTTTLADVGRSLFQNDRRPRSGGRAMAFRTVAAISTCGRDWRERRRSSADVSTPPVVPPIMRRTRSMRVRRVPVVILQQRVKARIGGERCHGCPSRVRRARRSVARDHEARSTIDGSPLRVATMTTAAVFDVSIGSLANGLFHRLLDRIDLGLQIRHPRELRPQLPL
jgi:hypothetical protein